MPLQNSKSYPGEDDKEKILQESTDDEDSDDEVVSGAQNAISEVEDTKKQMIEEEHQICSAEVASSPELPVTQQLEKVLRKARSIFRIRNQELGPLYIDGREFCIDGDALLMSILNSDCVDYQCGGQSLHIIYLIEKYLLLFKRKDLRFSIVFFEVWEWFWEKFSAQVAVVRSALCLHFIHNTSVPILIRKAMWENDFIDYVKQQRPSFILSLFEVPTFFSRMFSQKKKKKHLISDAEEHAQFLLNAQTFYCHFSMLVVVEAQSVSTGVTSVRGNVLMPDPRLQKLKKKVYNLIRTEMSGQQLRGGVFSDFIACGNVRSAVAVMTAVTLLKTKEVPKNMVQLYLVYSAMMEALPLNLRNPQVPTVGPPELECFIRLLQDKMKIILKALFKGNMYEFKLVADIWHGRLFHYLYSYVLTINQLDEEVMGTEICQMYKELITAVSKVVTIEPFPIKSFASTANRKCDLVVDVSEKNASSLNYNSLALMDRLNPASCELSQLFCKEIFLHKKQDHSHPIVECDFSELNIWNALIHGAFKETHHWHSYKPITDQYDRIKEKKIQCKSKQAEDRLKQGLSRWNMMYGRNVEGRDACARTIVTRKPEAAASVRRKPQYNCMPGKGKGKEKKVSKKELIIMANQKRISDEKLEKEQNSMSAFRQAFKALKDKGLYEKAVSMCDFDLMTALSPGAVVEISIKKLSALLNLWHKDSVSSKDCRNLSIVKKIFLTIKEILFEKRRSNIQMISEDLNYIGMVLCKLGFVHIAKCWDLPESPIDGKYQMNVNWAEFQLKYLGSKLDREEGSVMDPRADGFLPDPWQVKLFDIIDSNQSALVVAPTSSGKTYASYYCMEKVLEGSDDGVVIYVSPTKALVNQVSATIYARFRKILPPGKTLQGIFTRDYKMNVLNCQILTTVPEALEILLLSPRMQYWVTRIRYVIFDEIHCLAGQAGGVTWENLVMLIPCPFLALSATINDPEAFCTWLQSVEDFKKQRAQVDGRMDRNTDNSYQVHLVKYLDRHSHLTKSIMRSDGSFEHLHPYGLLDDVVLSENKGIPDHVTLSPSEALELYQTMTKIFPAEAIDKLAPDVYFKQLCQTGFLSMPSVKQYTCEMRNFLLRNRSQLSDVISALQPKFDELAVGREFVFSKFSQLLINLKKHHMLPALVFNYNRADVEILPLLALEYLEDQDDDSEDEKLSREERKQFFETVEDDKKPSKKQAKRRHTNKKFTKELGLLKGGNILNSNSSLRGGDAFDENLVKHIEWRLMKAGYTCRHEFIQALQRGVGRHHGGMGAKERSAVEMLFRMKMMSGRAGRRGYDLEGNVIFMGIKKERIQTLTTANVPKMVGNFPISISYIVRLLLLVSDSTDGKQFSKEAKQAAITRAYTVLESGLIYQTIPNLKVQIKHFFAFAIRFLIYQGLLDEAGKPQILCGIIVHLHYHPGVFAFVHLLQSGVLHKLCKVNKRRKKSERKSVTGEHEILVVLSYLFAPLPLRSSVKHSKHNNSKVVLPPLPAVVKEELCVFNGRSMDVFTHYLKCVGDHMNRISGRDTKLPLSDVSFESPTAVNQDIFRGEGSGVGHLLVHLKKCCRENHICSSFAALSGKTDACLFDENGNVKNVRHDVLPDVQILPTISLGEEYNSYALDFYLHGIKEAIRVDNGLKEGDDFKLLLDFLLAVKTLHISLEEMYGPEDCLVGILHSFHQRFNFRFERAYYALQERY